MSTANFDAICYQTRCSFTNDAIGNELRKIALQVFHSDALNVAASMSFQKLKIYVRLLMTEARLESHAV